MAAWTKHILKGTAIAIAAGWLITAPQPSYAQWWNENDYYDNDYDNDGLLFNDNEFGNDDSFGVGDRGVRDYGYGVSDFDDGYEDYSDYYDENWEGEEDDEGWLDWF